MKYVKLNTGANMPLLGLGTWQAETGEVYQAIRWAIKLGYKLIDCAAIYGNEKEVGQAIHDAIAEGDIKREELFITSKLWNDSHAPQDVMPALKKTLEDLQLDYLDLYLIHWPVAQKKGSAIPQHEEDVISLSEIPLEVTWAEMEKAQEMGLVKAIGVSNFSISKIKNLIEKGNIVPAVNQVESHPFLQQDELLDFCNKNQIVLTAYSPLGSSSNGRGEFRPLQNETIVKIADRIKSTPAQVLLAWQIMRNVVVIPKSVHMERLKENFASQAIELDNEDLTEIAKLNMNHRFITGNSFAYGDYTADSIWA